MDSVVMTESELIAYTVFLNDVPYTIWLHASPELDVHNNDHYSPHKDATNASTNVSKHNMIKLSINKLI